MPEDKGIYPKYVVFKHPDFIPFWLEGRAAPPEIGHSVPLELVGDFCFVLKPGSDRHARVAIAAYAQSVMEDKPLLGEELMQIISDGPRR